MISINNQLRLWWIMVADAGQWTNCVLAGRGSGPQAPPPAPRHHLGQKPLQDTGTQAHVRFRLVRCCSKQHGMPPDLLGLLAHDAAERRALRHRPDAREHRTRARQGTGHTCTCVAVVGLPVMADAHTMLYAIADACRVRQRFTPWARGCCGAEVVVVLPCAPRWNAAALQRCDTR